MSSVVNYLSVRASTLATLLAFLGARLALPQTSPPVAPHNCRFVKIPMRDGTKLNTSICEPRGPHEPIPFLLTRTPYGIAGDIDLHQQSYQFKGGHRIMVQVQSTWFPIYDRNPQTWVPNIFQAQAPDFQAQTHRIWHTPKHPSRIEVTIMRRAEVRELP